MKTKIKCKRSRGINLLGAGSQNTQVLYSHLHIKVKFTVDMYVFGL